MGMMLRMLLAVVVAGGTALTTVRAEEIRVSAAISLKDALIEAGKAYKKQSGDTLAFSFGASGQLLTQIKNGAPVDLFGLPQRATRSIRGRSTISNRSS